MHFPPHLLDELARVYANAALDRLLKEAEVLSGTREGEAEVPSPPEGVARPEKDGRPA